VTVVDIRDIRERWERGAIPGARSMPRGMLEFWFDPESPYYKGGFDFGDRYVVYCAGGGRSALAAVALQDLGYTQRRPPHRRVQRVEGSGRSGREGPARPEVLHTGRLIDAANSAIAATTSARASRCGA
jgi:rhodanese-related sulfurtransferase